MTLATFILYVFGATYVLCRSTLLIPLRVQLGRVYLLRLLVYCAYCTSFWVGVGLTLCGLYPMQYESLTWNLLEGGLVAVGAVVVVGALGPASLVSGQTWQEEYEIMYDVPPPVRELPPKEERH